MLWSGYRYDCRRFAASSECRLRRADHGPLNALCTDASDLPELLVVPDAAVGSRPERWCRADSSAPFIVG